MSTFSTISITSRTLAAFFAGYIFANASGIFLASLLPMTKGNALMIGMLFSFFFWVAAILWCFCTNTATRAWFGLIVPSIIFSLVSWLLKSFT